MTAFALRRTVLWLAAAALCTLGTLVGFAVWAFGLGHYLDDLCLTSPEVDAREFEVVRGPVVDGPVSLRCEFPGSDRAPVEITDWYPLLWTLGCALGVLAGVLVVVLLTRLLTRPRAAPAGA
ncbi:hypothetical protein EKO23_09405 [Nocardioides guangzhouensis]|uniref:Uncharacterized protein n=1 Tax=Nocardioides guangzhouensis TaxID=2497878 RepID=A0A4Q4ZGE9_9ACTN|nr:hypothetical protein [Nocardioides guangzhouensis]RYP86506.1 hypothetical protein EKO23_09405 [Nocardioides guangzhouensis]